VKIRIQPSAAKDLNYGFDFYQQRSVKVGEYFEAMLLSDINKLQFTAGIHSKGGHLFRAKSRKFPYWIYYRVAESTVYVVAILDARRSPTSMTQQEKKEQECFHDSNSAPC
jgi:plasmid stabilization system protein ParE